MASKSYLKFRYLLLHELLGHDEIRLCLKKLYTVTGAKEKKPEEKERPGLRWQDLVYLPKEAPTLEVDNCSSSSQGGGVQFCQQLFPPHPPFGNMEILLVVTVRAREGGATGI